MTLVVNIGVQPASPPPNWAPHQVPSGHPRPRCHCGAQTAFHPEETQSSVKLQAPGSLGFGLELGVTPTFPPRPWEAGRTAGGTASSPQKKPLVFRLNRALQMYFWILLLNTKSARINASCYKCPRKANTFSLSVALGGAAWNASTIFIVFTDVNK